MRLLLVSLLSLHMEQSKKWKRDNRLSARTPPDNSCRAWMRARNFLPSADRSQRNEPRRPVVYVVQVFRTINSPTEQQAHAEAKKDQIQACGRSSFFQRSFPQARTWSSCSL